MQESTIVPEIEKTLSEIRNFSYWGLNLTFSSEQVIRFSPGISQSGSSCLQLLLRMLEELTCSYESIQGFPNASLCVILLQASKSYSWYFVSEEVYCFHWLRRWVLRYLNTNKLLWAKLWCEFTKCQLTYSNWLCTCLQPVFAFILEHEQAVLGLEHPNPG